VNRFASTTARLKLELNFIAPWPMSQSLAYRSSQHLLSCFPPSSPGTEAEIHWLVRNVHSPLVCAHRLGLGIKLNLIPAVGFSDPVLSYLSAFYFNFLDGTPVLKESYEKVTQET
jgi:hypothetical protein